MALESSISTESEESDTLNLRKATVIRETEIKTTKHRLFEQDGETGENSKQKQQQVIVSYKKKLRKL